MSWVWIVWYGLLAPLWSEEVDAEWDMAIECLFHDWISHFICSLRCKFVLLVLACGFENMVSGFIPALLFRQILLHRQPCLATLSSFLPDKTRLDTNATATWKMNAKSINGQFLTQMDATSYYHPVNRPYWKRGEVGEKTPYIRTCWSSGAWKYWNSLISSGNILYAYIYALSPSKGANTGCNTYTESGTSPALR